MLPLHSLLKVKVLTVRETEIVLSLCHGASYRDIAAKYGIHRNSLYHSLYRARRKFGVKTMNELIARVAVEDYKRRQRPLPDPVVQEH